MSLFAILESIQKSGDMQIRKIESQAYVKCNEILANIRLEAEQVKRDAYDKAVAPAFKERARIIQRARLEGLQILGDAREEFVDSAFEQIHSRLANIRTEESYPQILCQLIEEALGELRGSLTEAGEIKLEADPRDRVVLESILHEMPWDFSVTYVLDCWGGLVAKSGDGRVVAINTMETRLERATPHLRRYLAALFENEGPEFELSQVPESQLVSI